MDGDTQVCILNANSQSNDSTLKHLAVEQKSSGDVHVSSLINSHHWLNAEANSWMQMEYGESASQINPDMTNYVAKEIDPSLDLHLTQECNGSSINFRRCQPQSHSTHSVFHNSKDSMTTGQSSTRNSFRSVSASCVLEITSDKHEKLTDDERSGRASPVGSEGFCLNDEETEFLATSANPVPKFRPTINQHPDEDEPDPELPRMSTILENLPWNSVRAREYLVHYLELAELKGDTYKVSKLKQQLKYLNIRHKKRSYSEDNNQWGPGNSPSTTNGKSKNNSDSWWRNGMKTNQPVENSASHRGSSNWEGRHSNGGGWNHFYPNNSARIAPVLRATNHISMNLPLPPPPWVSPYWDPGCSPNWTRPHYTAAWAPIPCPPCPPPWVYRRPPLPPPPPMAGGDIFRMRQDIRWPKRMGRF